MSPGENVKETALRELKEETNIDAKIEGLLGVYSDPKYGSVRKYNDDDFSQQIIDIMFHASPLSFDIKKSDESLDVKFLDLDNLPENITPTIKNVLQDYKDKQDDSPIVK
jgi:ADP-ribose pyrophosphatase YjhB (NUDIX family)